MNLREYIRIRKISAYLTAYEDNAISTWNFYLVIKLLEEEYKWYCKEIDLRKVHYRWT